MSKGARKPFKRKFPLPLKIKPEKPSFQECVISALSQVHAYASDVDDWVVVKRELMKHLGIDEQALLSTRDPITKKQNFNEFERVLTNCWEKMTGRQIDLSRVNVQ